MTTSHRNQPSRGHPCLGWLTLAGVLSLPSCALPALGQSYYKASLAAEPAIVEVVVVGAQPVTAGVASSETALPSPGLPKLSETEQPLASDWTPDWRARFVPTSEFAFDFGVGEAPYDDNDHDYFLDYRPPQGFSDALVLLEWRNHVGPGLSWHGIAALQRVQEDTLFEAVDQADWAWFGLGLQWSW